MRTLMTGMRVGAIDLGSNSFHLLVADYEGGGRLRRVAREKKNLRLGDVVARCGEITDTLAEDAVATVRQLRDRAIASGAEVIFGAATSAFRDASNGPRLLDRIQTETGVHLRLIDGCEEGRLVFEAVQASLELTTIPAVCLDLGGGSLEVVVGDQFEIYCTASLPLGVVRLRAQLLKSDPPTPRETHKLYEHAATVIAAQAEPALRFGPRSMIGAGGTFRSIARIVAAQSSSTVPASINGMIVTRAELTELCENLVRLPAEQRRQMPGVGRRRADLAPAGALVVLAAMESFEQDEITVAEWTLREGLVLDAVTKAQDPAWVDPTQALALAIRQGVDLNHATRVSMYAVDLFDAGRPFHSLGADDRELLVEAALLHDAGRASDPESHHKAGGRAVMEGLGNHHARAELASLVRFHTSSEPKSSFEFYRELEPTRQDTVTKLLAVLRMADWLASSGSDLATTIASTGVGIAVEVPRTYPAASIWELGQRARLLEQSIGCTVEISRGSGSGADAGALARRP